MRSLSIVTAKVWTTLKHAFASSLSKQILSLKRLSSLQQLQSKGRRFSNNSTLVAKVVRPSVSKVVRPSVSWHADSRQFPKFLALFQYCTLLEIVGEESQICKSQSLSIFTRVTKYLIFTKYYLPFAKFCDDRKSVCAMTWPESNRANIYMLQLNIRIDQ